jgi:hypothetical protein
MDLPWLEPCVIYPDVSTMNGLTQFPVGLFMNFRIASILRAEYTFFVSHLCFLII